jgi:hypothetical protein
VKLQNENDKFHEKLSPESWKGGIVVERKYDQKLRKGTGFFGHRCASVVVNRTLFYE